MKRRAVIFDLDGTLTDTLESIAYTTNLTLSRFGLPPFEKERYRYFVGDGTDVMLRKALLNAQGGSLSLLEQAQEEYLKLFEKYCGYHVRPYEGITELLGELKARGVKTAVLSNKPHPRTLDVVETFFGKESFDYVQGLEPGIERKPSPEGVFKIMGKLGVKSEELLYVGDTDTDMKTGRAAGAFTAGVLWGFRDRQELETNGADVIISKPCELLKYLETE